MRFIFKERYVLGGYPKSQSASYILTKYCKHSDKKKEGSKSSSTFCLWTGCEGWARK